MRQFLSIDIGGTAIKYGLVTETGEIRRRKKYDAFFDAYQTPLLTTLQRSVKDFYQELVAQGEPIDGIALSVTGDVDSESNRLDDGCGSIPGWTGIALDEEIAHAIGRPYPTTALNDANAAALAEMWSGNAQGYRHAIVYTIGTGIGGGIIVDGKILNGARGYGGNIGHMAICSTPQNCHCGNNGCFEYVASTRALLRAAKKVGFEGDGEALFAAAGADVRLQGVLDEFFRYHGIAVASLLHIFNSEAILIGGGISNQGQWFLDRIREEAHKYCLPHFIRGVDFKIAKHTNDAGLLGAVKYFLDKRSV